MPKAPALYRTPAELGVIPALETHPLDPNRILYLQSCASNTINHILSQVKS
jgi:hypothetical protein